MKKIMTNKEIYQSTLNLREVFGTDSEINLPIKVNYNIQRNLSILIEISKGIEKVKDDIGKKYGVYNEEDNSYHIPKDLRNTAQNELDQLMNMKEEVEVRTITLSDLQDIPLNSVQMQVLLFMIEE